MGSQKGENMIRNELIQRGLSNRESEVLSLFFRDLRKSSIAEQLYVTEKTIDFHLSQIKKKLNIKTQKGLREFYCDLLLKLKKVEQ